MNIIYSILLLFSRHSVLNVQVFPLFSKHSQVKAVLSFPMKSAEEGSGLLPQVWTPDFCPLQMAAPPAGPKDSHQWLISTKGWESGTHGPLVFLLGSSTLLLLSPSCHAASYNLGACPLGRTKAGVSNLLASLGHTGRRKVVLVHTLNTLRHVLTNNLIMF